MAVLRPRRASLDGALRAGLAEHIQHHDGPMSGSRRTSPLPRDRPRIRRQVLRRDRHVCQIQGPNCSYVATEVDHVGSPEDHRPESLQSAYRTCHGEKTKQQAAAGRSAQFAAWLAARSRPTEVHPGRVEPR